MLLRLSKNVVAPYQTLQKCCCALSDPPKMYYSWRIRHASINIFEEFKQHRIQHCFYFSSTQKANFISLPDKKKRVSLPEESN